jgi:hypothetical protein
VRTDPGALVGETPSLDCGTAEAVQACSDDTAMNPDQSVSCLLLNNSVRIERQRNVKLGDVNLDEDRREPGDARCDCRNILLLPKNLTGGAGDSRGDEGQSRSRAVRLRFLNQPFYAGAMSSFHHFRMAVRETEFSDRATLVLSLKAL